MKKNDPDILVQRFIDGELSDAEVEGALHRIADNAEARELLQFELRMTQNLAASPSSSPPKDFAARTMEAVVREPAVEENRGSLQQQIETLWKSITAPVAVQLRPASALVAVLLAGVVAWMAWPLGMPGPQATVQTASEAQSQSVQQASAQTAEKNGTVWIRFLYTDNQADSVAVAGDFSQWDPIELSPREVNGETVWTGLVPVTRGEHEYQFLINGEQWVTDPLAPVKRSDGFGAENAVLNI